MLSNLSRSKIISCCLYVQCTVLSGGSCFSLYLIRYKKVPKIYLLFFTVADSQLKFLYKPQNTPVSLNDDNAYLLCVATGGVSLYTWLKDDVSINNSGVDYQLAAGGSILSFPNVTTNIQGVYTCVVENETNQTINGSALLYILSKF